MLTMGVVMGELFAQLYMIQYVENHDQIISHLVIDVNFPKHHIDYSILVSVKQEQISK